MTYEREIKIGLAVLFFLCLLNMPYGYYQLVRFIALVGFSFLALHSFENKNHTIVYISLALAFQPFIKLSLGRVLWNIVDVVVGIGLIASLYADKTKSRD